MIAPQSVAIATSGYLALEGGDRSAHSLLTEFIDELDGASLVQVVENLTLAVAVLLSRLHEEHPGFDRTEWLRQFGLVAAGAR